MEFEIFFRLLSGDIKQAVGLKRPEFREEVQAGDVSEGQVHIITYVHY